jgi:hypothetical protein
MEVAIILLVIAVIFITRSIKVVPATPGHRTGKIPRSLTLA